MLLRCRFVSSLLMATRQTFSCSIHADGCCSWTYRNLYVTICESQDLEMRVEGTVRFFEPVATSFYLFFLRRLERRGEKKKPKDKYPKSKRSSGWTGAAMRATFSTLTDVGRIIFRWWIIIVVLYLFVVDVFFFSFQNWEKETCCCHIVCSPRQSDIINSNR